MAVYQLIFKSHVNAEHENLYCTKFDILFLLNASMSIIVYILQNNTLVPIICK